MELRYKKILKNSYKKLILKTTFQGGFLFILLIRVSELTKVKEKIKPRKKEASRKGTIFY